MWTACNLHDLAGFSLADNQLTSVCNGDLTWATNMKYLKLRGNLMTQGSNISFPKGLISLDLSHNDIKEWPWGISNTSAQALRNLNLSNNAITGLLHIPSLQSLMKLALGQNTISTIIVEGTIPLEILDLSGNNLSELPNLTHVAASLETLDVSSNQIHKVNSTAFTHMQHLKNLKIQG